MRLRTVSLNGDEVSCVALPDGRLARVDHVLPGGPSDLLSLLATEQLNALADAMNRGVEDADCVDPDTPVLAPWTRPRKILGIGLNYGAHAGDLGEQAPRTSPASFIKGDHTIVGPGEPIVIPTGIGKVTAEAELGLVIGRTCYQVASRTRCPMWRVSSPSSIRPPRPCCWRTRATSHGSRTTPLSSRSARI